MRDSNRTGFTFVEIMIVVLIIGTLALLIVPKFLRSRKDTWRAVCVNNLRLLADAKELWALSGHTAVPSLTDLNPYVKRFPRCPAGVQPYTPGPINALPVCPNVGTYADHVVTR
jgi:prepilin-type N-terminal cleavage/methylation domain-containing protein